MLEPGTDLPGRGTESWWWCRRCHAFVDLKDAGDAYPQCEECGSRQVEFRRVAEACRPADGRTVAFIKRPEVVSLEAKPLTRVRKHLSKEKKDLRRLVHTGFWFCYADECRQITEVLPGRGNIGDLICSCCGAPLTREANWTEPAFKEAEPDGATEVNEVNEVNEGNKAA